MVPSSCQGVVLELGYSRCQLMLSLRMVVAERIERLSHPSQLAQTLIVVQHRFGTGSQNCHL